MADDILKDLPIERVHRWYNRLADAALAKTLQGRLPLSGQFLKAYVNPRQGTAPYQFTAPAYLQRNAAVVAALQFHRRVFLSEEQARLGDRGRTRSWAGLIPRLQDKRWDGASPLALYYQSLVDVAPSRAAVVRIQLNGTEEERDLFTSLRGFQLRSDVEVIGRPKGRFVSVQFRKWTATAFDRYDFNYDEYLTLPNPDFESTAPDAIRPDLESFRVYHTNAKRMVDRGLAKPYDLSLGPWTVTRADVIASGDIDPAKRL